MAGRRTKKRATKIKWILPTWWLIRTYVYILQPVAIYSTSHL